MTPYINYTQAVNAGNRASGLPEVTEAEALGNPIVAFITAVVVILTMLVTYAS